jgi:formate-dependent nitrite reductase membrane component NrfD
MTEELFVSGRHIEHIDPYLNLWGGPIAIYLFLGGLAAAILIFANFFFLMGKADKYPMTAKVSTLIPPVIISFGLILLVYDLHHKLYFWQLLLNFRIESPMSWGAWTLTFIMIPAILWPLIYMRDIIDYLSERNPACRLLGLLNWIDKMANKFGIVRFFIGLAKTYQKPMAYITIVLSLILGVYTGILLSAFNARPLWNTAILGPLFLTSGVSTGAALLMWMSKNHDEKRLFSKLDLILISVEIFLIIHLFMGMKAGPLVQYDTAMLFLGGPYTSIFWVGVMGLGLVFPAILEILELNHYKIPSWLPALFILSGGLAFRYIMVYAGQFSSYNIL